MEKVRQVRDSVKRRGYHAETLLPNKKGYYRKQDGTIHSVLLPLDGHHLALYGKKGWSPVQEDDAEAELNAQREETRKARNARLVLADGHMHDYNKKLGSPCKSEGCPQVRMKPYIKRSKQ